MNKLLSTVALVILGLVALGAVGPRLTQLVGSLVSTLTVSAVIGTVLYIVVRLVNDYLNRW